MRVLDDAILAAIRGTGVNVYDGDVPVDDSGSTVTVTAVVPYAVYYSNLGDTAGRRLDGSAGTLPMDFQVTFVGTTRAQAKWAGEKVRAALDGQRLTVTGHRSWMTTLQESQRVIPDKGVLLASGQRLFYGVDLYRTAVTA